MFMKLNTCMGVVGTFIILIITANISIGSPITVLEMTSISNRKRGG